MLQKAVEYLKKHNQASGVLNTGNGQKISVDETNLQIN